MLSKQFKQVSVTLPVIGVIICLRDVHWRRRHQTVEIIARISSLALKTNIEELNTLNETLNIETLRSIQLLSNYTLAKFQIYMVSENPKSVIELSGTLFGHVAVFYVEQRVSTGFYSRPV